MNDNQQQIVSFLYRLAAGEHLAGSEQQLLKEWADQSLVNADLLARVQDESRLRAELSRRLGENTQLAWERLLNRISQEVAQTLTADLESADTLASDIPPVHRIHFLKTSWFRYAAAIIVMVGLGAYLWTIQQKEKAFVAATTNPISVQNDVPPGGNKATLTLADGSRIILDSAANGQLAIQGGVQVVKLANGQIAYDLRGLTSDSKDVIWNTISTPKGGQYQVTLPDGTKVWLNASSSITFPTAFIASKRDVKITGEIYFEVAKDKQKPFIVNVNEKSWVEVLGTSFNINSYGDEGSIKTILVEGSVKVNSSVVLKPGQQATQYINTTSFGVTSNPQLQITEGNITQTLAWKNGIFDFTGADLRTVMRQLERWYDIEVQYKGSISNITFEGSMYRNVNLSDVLEVLQEMGVMFELNGKNLIVL